MKKHIWKTKKNERGQTSMICMNSKRELSKYGEFCHAGEDECSEWSFVDPNADSVLCSKCTSTYTNKQIENL